MNETIVSMQGVTPILRMYDIKKTKAFYLEFLGFQLDWEHRFEPGLPLYMQVSHSNCKIHLSEHHGDCSPGAAIRIPIRNIETFHQNLLATNYKYARPGLETAIWQAREVTVLDPAGNRLVFTEPLQT